MENNFKNPLLKQEDLLGLNLNNLPKQESIPTTNQPLMNEDQEDVESLKNILKQYETLGQTKVHDEEELKRLQKQKNVSDFLNVLNASGKKYLQGVATSFGGKIDADEEGNKMLEKLAAKPLEDYKEQVKLRESQLEKQRQQLADILGVNKNIIATKDTIKQRAMQQANDDFRKKVTLDQEARAQRAADTTDIYNRLGIADRTIDLETTKQMADPNSDISKFTRERAYKAFPEIKGQLDNMSAAQMKMAGIPTSGVSEYQEAMLNIRRDSINLREKQEEERKMESFSKRLENDEILPRLESFKKIDEIMLANPNDLPGFGPVESVLPNALINKEGVELRTNLKGLANALLKARSGAAVTDQEYKRFLEETAAGNFGTEKDLKIGYKKMKRDFEQQAKTIESGYSSDVKNLWKENTGFGYLPSEFFKKENQLKSNETERRTKDGRIAIFDMTQTPPKFVRYKE